MLCERDECSRLTPRGREPLAADVLEPVLRLVLHAEQPLKLLRRVGAVRRDLADERNGVAVVLGARASSQRSAAGRVRRSNPSQHRARRGGLLVLGAAVGGCQLGKLELGAGVAQPAARVALVAVLGARRVAGLTCAP